MDDTEKNTARPDCLRDESAGDTAEILNVGGHKQELDRNFSLLSVTALGVVNGNAWAAFAGSMVGLSSSVKAYR